MPRTPTLILALVLLISSTAAAPQQYDTRPGMVPGHPFYMVEKFVEGLEVELAGVIGGEDMKAKALANNAEERLAEAQKLKEKNKSEKAEKTLEDYDKTLNRSKKTAEKSGNAELGEQINQISRKNTEKLKEIREKTPEKADKGLNKAINRSGGVEARSENLPPASDRRTEKIPPELSENPEEMVDKTKNSQNNDKNQETPEIGVRNPSIANETLKDKKDLEKAGNDTLEKNLTVEKEINDTNGTLNEKNLAEDVDDSTGLG